MIIASISENKDLEKRISITPEISKKYINLGFEVHLIENYGSHLGFKDEEYKSSGVKIVENEKDLFNQSDIIVQLSLPSDDKLSYFKEKQILLQIAYNHLFQSLDVHHNFRLTESQNLDQYIFLQYPGLLLFFSQSLYFLILIQLS